jgi:hypothetical protein
MKLYLHFDKKNLIIITILNLYLSYSQLNYATTIGLWHFDEGNGINCADSSIPTHNGTTTNTTWTDTSKSGKALHFYKTGSYVLVNNHSDFEFGTGSFTIEAWIKSSNNGQNRIANYGSPDPAPSNGWSFILNAGKLNFNIEGDEGAGLFTTESKWADGQWHHVGAIRNALTQKLQIWADGELVAQMDDPHPEFSLLTGGRFVIGMDHRNLSGTGDFYSCFSGIIDEVKLSNTESPLPITLSSFTAIYQNDSVILTWITESEINNLGFNIYKKTLIDNKFYLLSSYKHNQSLRGRGNSSIRQIYQYSDKNIHSNIEYQYKLIQMDYNGISTEYETISIYLQKNTNTVNALTFCLYQNYPNPFNSITKIPFNLPKKSYIKFTFFNITGKIVQTTDGFYESGHHELLFNSKSLSSGMYYVKLENGNNIDINKIVILK